MSSRKSARSSKAKESPNESSPKAAKAPGLRKVFYIAENLLKDDCTQLNLERFYHPGKGKAALFVTGKEHEILEVIEFTEPRRSWLIDNAVCSNGRIYMTTPVDVTFLALHHIREHCTEKALQLDSIHDEKDPSVARLLTKFVSGDQLLCVADVKTVGELKFYKYNAEKTIAWLALKAKHLAASLKDAGVYCGLSAISANYVPIGRAAEELVNEIDYLRMACDLVGNYLDLDLLEELTRYLAIPSESQSIATEQNAANNKRKSLQSLKSSENKKTKLDKDISEGAEVKFNDSLPLESADSQEDEQKNSIESKIIKPSIVQERVLTAKEKALAKSAKGTRSISSFFKK